jgi:arylsulfatase
MLAEIDYNVGQMLDAVDRLGIRDNTIVIFASDNGPEYIRPWDGWAGPWRGQYFTALEGGIRVPFMIRWPGKVPAGHVSDGIVHGVDLFPTLAALPAPSCRRTDRSTAWTSRSFSLAKAKNRPRRHPHLLLGSSPGREVAKLQGPFLSAGHNGFTACEARRTKAFNLYTNPLEDDAKPTVESWIVGPVLKMVGAFEARA